MNLTLPTDVFSPDQVNELILELDDMRAALRRQSVKQSGEFEPSARLVSLLKANSVTASVEAADELSKGLQEILKNAPTAHMILAAVPSSAVRRQFTAWFRAEIHPLTLMTFALRSDLGGGAVVQIGSHLYDFSFKRLVLANAHRLTEIAGV